MGAKYLPTKKDLKATQRYRDNNHPLPHTRKSSIALPKVKPLPAAPSTGDTAAATRKPAE
jgi:hypothetical protein